MRIVLLGGGTGGHFYPLMAVARALREIAEEEHIVALDLRLLGDKPFDGQLVEEYGITYDEIPAGKLRRYFSLLNFTDSFRTLRGILKSMWKFTLRPPDVIFSKGGYDSFPALVAARLYRIPVVIHESDAVPGMVNLWASKFADRIGIAFPEAASSFPPEKVALIGNPIRKEILGGSTEEAFDIFQLENGVPLVLVLGGSQGAQKINEVILAGLPEFVEKMQIIHSAGPAHGESIKNEAAVMLEKSVHQSRYHVFPTLTPAQLRNAAFAADVVVSRAGAGSIFEIAAWGLPSLLVPISSSAQNHQRENAYSYARIGAAEVIEEANFTPHLLQAEIMKLLGDAKRRDNMKKAAAAFARIDAAEKIAHEVLRLGIHD
ncbi:MAG: undecaprenyldiphospho-muramoylpentapeptide beta-N-acetylglucosaminyltransferase [Candidatus Ryanbacteria bacterium]|nr:undecaprenyldiphospho-muramoylpentapeptide beta-N-acetylglucosaminyltransferase [Candidatus Ryanbacteria bacterium]